MSRSRRRMPVVGITTAESEKDKRRQPAPTAGRRRAVRAGAEAAPHRRKLSNPWDFAKDGKPFLQVPDPKLLRK